MKLQHRFLVIVILLKLSSCQISNDNKTDFSQDYRFENDTLLLFIQDEDTLETVFEIELAISDYQKETGLMHRRQMQPNQGMLFVYKEEDPRPSFYMKNTYIALDLIYINKDFEIVDIVLNTKPLSEALISSTVPSQYVLEVNSGIVNELNLKPGNTVILK